MVPLLPSSGGPRIFLVADLILCFCLSYAQGLEFSQKMQKGPELGEVEWWHWSGGTVAG